MQGRAARSSDTLLLLDWQMSARSSTSAAASAGFSLPLLVQEPHLRGVLFDLEHVAADGRTAIAAAGVGDRCEVESGSFFESVPEAATSTSSRTSLHDW